MRFAILLPVYNHLAYTKLTLERLAPLLDEIEGDVFDILLIDDGSTDGTSDWVRLNYPDVILLHGNGDLWWSGAINKGARYALNTLKSDYIILWNNDIGIDPQFFFNLLKIVSSLESSEIIGSKIYVDGEKDIVWSAGGYFNPKSGKSNMYGYFEEDNEELNRVREVDLLTGMGTIVPREVIDRIGYWDNINFPQYHGDSDFTYRATLAGFKNKVYPELKLYNDVQNSGIEHEGSWKKLIMIFTDIRSKSNLRKNFLFQRKYAKSPRAYIPLIWLYVKIVGGFFKLKVLNLFHVKRREAI